MKTLITLFFLCLQTYASAEICTSVIKDRIGNEWETFTRSAYSQEAACDQAMYDCQTNLSYGQSRGRYYDAYCDLKWGNYPTPSPRGLVCQTDLVDYYGRTVRSFTAPGASEREACNTSDNFCKMELARHDSYGSRCVNRGLIGNRNDPRPPSRTKTESCTVNRLDPAGMFIQSYTSTASGPIYSDVKSEACSLANRHCSSELRGRQTCQIYR